MIYVLDECKLIPYTIISGKVGAKMTIAPIPEWLVKNKPVTVKMILCSFLRHHDMSQKEFANMLGVSYSSVSKWINCKRTVPPWVLEIMKGIDDGDKDNN